MPPTRVRPPLHRDLADDAGFTVLEALVSFILLAVVGGASALVTTSAISTSAKSGNRVKAANLAQQDLQGARALRYPNYPAPVSARVVTAGSTRYTITRTVSSACPAQPDYDAHPYMLVQSTVTWAPTSATNQVVMAMELAC